jgi:hypothetical protein
MCVHYLDLSGNRRLNRLSRRSIADQSPLIAGYHRLSLLIADASTFDADQIVSDWQANPHFAIIA